MIELKNISKTFKTKANTVPALKDISLEVDDGDILGIVGTSGAGKSTLVRCINLLEQPDTGQVIIDGKNLMDMSKKELEKQRTEIGMIFQHFNLMSQRNVFKNVAYPLALRGDSKEEIRKRVTELLALVGISDKANAYPAQLSGGQKQRVAIARALASQPKVLLCDEATSALDPETTKSILALLKDINEKLKLRIIVITHEKEVVKAICNKVVVLDKGQVAEKGNTIDIFTDAKTDAGRAFVGSILEDEHVIEALGKFVTDEQDSGKIYKLTFIGQKSENPYISTISKKYDVYASILFGNIDVIGRETLGNLVVKFSGDEGNIKLAVKYLKENHILAEEVA